MDSNYNINVTELFNHKSYDQGHQATKGTEPMDLHEPQKKTTSQVRSLFRHGPWCKTSQNQAEKHEAYIQQTMGATPRSEANLTHSAMHQSSCHEVNLLQNHAKCKYEGSYQDNSVQRTKPKQQNSIMIITIHHTYQGCPNMIHGRLQHTSTDLQHCIHQH